MNKIYSFVQSTIQNVVPTERTQRMAKVSVLFMRTFSSVRYGIVAILTAVGSSE